MKEVYTGKPAGPIMPPKVLLAMIRIKSIPDILPKIKITRNQTPEPKTSTT